MELAARLSCLSACLCPLLSQDSTYRRHQHRAARLAGGSQADQCVRHSPRHVTPTLSPRSVRRAYQPEPLVLAPAGHYFHF